MLLPNEPGPSAATPSVLEIPIATDRASDDVVRAIEQVCSELAELAASGNMRDAAKTLERLEPLTSAYEDLLDTDEVEPGDGEQLEHMAQVVHQIYAPHLPGSGSDDDLIASRVIASAARLRLLGDESVA